MRRSVFFVGVLVLVGCYEAGTNYTPVRTPPRSCDPSAPVDAAVCPPLGARAAVGAECRTDEDQSTFIECHYGADASVSRD